MNKLSSYQKLKRENKRLKQKIYFLIKEPDSSEAVMIRTGYILQYNILDTIMFGCSKQKEDTYTYGVLGRIKKSKFNIKNLIPWHKKTQKKTN